MLVEGLKSHTKTFYTRLVALTLLAVLIQLHRFYLFKLHQFRQVWTSDVVQTFTNLVMDLYRQEPLNEAIDLENIILKVTQLFDLQVDLVCLLVKFLQGFEMFL